MSAAVLARMMKMTRAEAIEAFKAAGYDHGMSESGDSFTYAHPTTGVCVIAGNAAGWGAGVCPSVTDMEHGRNYVDLFPGVTFAGPAALLMVLKMAGFGKL